MEKAAVSLLPFPGASNTAANATVPQAKSNAVQDNQKVLTGTPPPPAGEGGKHVSNLRRVPFGTVYIIAGLDVYTVPGTPKKSWFLFLHNLKFCPGTFVPIPISPLANMLTQLPQ